MTGRSDLATLVPLDGPVAAKTFVIEVHTDDPAAYLADLENAGPPANLDELDEVVEGAAGHSRELAETAVEPTDDAYLWKLSVRGAGEFLVDSLAQRFWSFHTVMPSATAVAWLRDRVETRRDTDWMWLPSAHLRHIAPEAVSRRVRTEFRGGRLAGSADDPAQDLRVQLTGTHADDLLDRIAAMPEYRHAVSFHSIEVELDDPDLGPLREAVRRSGLFAAHGEDFAHHAQFVRTVVGRYARLIDAIESVALAFSPLPGNLPLNQLAAGSDSPAGAALSGMPVGVRFSREITDLPRFCDELFSARAPFRLWGQPEITGDTAMVDAVDLHVGQRLAMEIGRDWMRVYLTAGACGNTIARLVSNLQVRFDSALELSQPGLQEAATLEPAAT